MKKIISFLFLLFLIVYANAQCWKYVDAGITYTAGFSVAIKNDGTLWAWGDNTYGQLGDGTNMVKYTPVQIGTDDDWKIVSCQSLFVLALKTDGTLWAWGRYEASQYGGGTTIYTNVPQQIGTDNDWKIISAGGGHSMAIKNDGTLWGWGYNFYGEVGDGTNQNRSIPVKIGSENNWDTVCAASAFTVAKKNDGTIWAWGNNQMGQLGDGVYYFSRSTPKQIGTDTDWKSISAKGNNTFAIKNNGTLWGWGSNAYGQIVNAGDQYIYAPIQFESATDWQSVYNGYYTVQAKKNNGRLFGWGDDGTGTTGANFTYPPYTYKFIVYSPLPIGTDTDWKSFGAGGSHKLAIKNDGSLWVWGSNEKGQMGIGTSSKIPLQLPCPESATPQKISVCSPIGNTTLFCTRSGLNYRWQVNTGSGFTDIINNSYYSYADSPSLHVNNIPSDWYGYIYRCKVDGYNSERYSLKFTDVWTGAAGDSTWENEDNWSCGSVPDTNTDVYINTGTVIINSDITIRSLAIESGVIFKIQDGKKLTITH